MSNYPLIKFVLCFIVGISVQNYFLFPFFVLMIALTIFIITLILLQIIQNQKPKNLKFVFTFLTIVILGASYYSSASQINVKYPFEFEKYKDAKILGNVIDIELKKENKFTFVLETDSIHTETFSLKRNYKFICSIKDGNSKIDSIYEILGIGNKIIINGNLFRPRDERNIGEFDYEKYLNGKGISAIVNVYKTNDVKIVSTETSLINNTIHNVRKTIDEQVSKYHNKTTSGLLRGLLLADRSSIDYAVKTEFINAGVVHVLSVSGLHVGYIVLIFLVLLNRFNIFYRYSLTLVGLLFYLIITGADSPVFRSTVMAIIIMAAPLTGREYNSLNALSLSALIILLINPGELFNPSFQLSYSAILSLIVIYPPLKKSVENLRLQNKWLKWFLIFCVTSLSAQIGTLPFTLTYFHRLSITALFANLLVIPVSGAIVALGIVTIFLGSMISFLGNVFASSNELLTYFMYYFVRLMGGDNYSYLTINQFSSFDAAVFYVTIVLMFYIGKKFKSKKPKVIGFALSAILCLIIIQLDNYEHLPKNVLAVYTIDVGQGDATLIKFPNGKTALLDAGDANTNFDNGKRIITPLLSQLNIDKIDYAFISHVDSDHYMGFISLIADKKIKFIYKPKIDKRLQKDIEFEKYLHLLKIPFGYYSKLILKIGNCRLYFLNDTVSQNYSNLSSNDQSGMIKLVYGKNSFLFTGDASIKVEESYIKNYKYFLKSNYLKAGHHGSKTSTSDNFIKFVNPSFTIISAGVMNKFKHPHKETLDRISKINSIIFRTDKLGGLLFVSNGSNIKFIDWRNRKKV